MAKKIVDFIKLQVPAGKANPSPPIGPALGQRGLNIMEFCKAFNAQTQKMEAGLPIPVVITAIADKSFTFVMKTPPASILIRKAAKVDKGSSKPHTDKVGKISRKLAGARRFFAAHAQPWHWATIPFFFALDVLRIAGLVLTGRIRDANPKPPSSTGSR